MFSLFSLNFSSLSFKFNVLLSSDDFLIELSELTSSAGADNGMVYGNGTMNPILGYAITKSAGGFIETAQMK